MNVDSLLKFKARSANDQVGSMLGVLEQVADTGKPKAGEQTSAQIPLINTGAMPTTFLGTQYQTAGGILLAQATGFGSLWNTAFPGSPFNFCGAWLGAPGDPIARKGGYVPYRLMDLDPTLRLVQSFIRGPILASSWTIIAQPGVEISETATVPQFDGYRCTVIPKRIIDAVSDMLLPIRFAIIGECIRYLGSGWRPFERVYERKNGLMWLTKLKPLLPDYTNIIDAGGGNFGGLHAKGAGLGPRKSWICSYDVEAGNLYGLSRHEAALDPWMDKQYARVRAALLTAKLSGVLPVVYYKPGTTPMPGGAQDNSDIAKRILATLFSSAGVAVPTTEYSDSDLQENPKLAGLSPWKVDILNAGSYSPAIDGMIRERQYLDAQMVRAWGWPERAVLEASKAGSRADSESHTDSASFDLELIDDDIARQLSGGQAFYDVPGVVDEIVALNWDERLRGVVSIKPSPLVDDKVSVYTQLLQTVFGNPSLATTFASVVNWTDILSHLDISTSDDVKEKLPKLIEAARVAQAQQQQQTAQTVDKAATQKPAGNKIAGGTNLKKGESDGKEE